MTDPLGVMYRWQVLVERAGLQGAEGLMYEVPAPEMAKIKIRNEMIIDSLGREIESIAVVTMPFSTRTIPVDSKLKLPVELSGQTAAKTVFVAAEGRHDTKIPGMPRFYRVYLKAKNK